jgi:hypothetical protein
MLFYVVFCISVCEWYLQVRIFEWFLLILTYFLFFPSPQDVNKGPKNKPSILGICQFLWLGRVFANAIVATDRNKCWIAYWLLGASTKLVKYVFLVLIYFLLYVRIKSQPMIMLFVMARVLGLFRSRLGACLVSLFRGVLSYPVLR